MKTVAIRDGRELTLRKLVHAEFRALNEYLNNLSEPTKKKFGPHPYDLDSITAFYSESRNIGFVAVDAAGMIVSYSVIRIGFPDHDQPRLESYGLKLSHETDACFAPSVSDQWQSLGIGDLVLVYILEELSVMNIQRIILWGGVQMDNEKAINYYRKNGFAEIGQFEYNGWNLDMMREL